MTRAFRFRLWSFCLDQSLFNIQFANPAQIIIGAERVRLKSKKFESAQQPSDEFAVSTGGECDTK